MHRVAGLVFPRPAVDFFGTPEAVLNAYLPEDYASDVGDADVRGTVHVEAGWRGEGAMGAVDETRWLEDLDPPHLRAIVAQVDLSLGDRAAEVISAHVAASERVRGVRMTLSHHPSGAVLNGCEDPKLMDAPEFRRGYRHLAGTGLTFDATVYHHQLGRLHGLASAIPDVPVVLDHAGTPTAYGGAFGGRGITPESQALISDAWQASMRTLAELPHVHVKISGLLMPILGWGYHHAPQPRGADEIAADLQPMVDFIVDTFGADRAMFASNFPVDRVSAGWRTLYDAFAQTVQHRSDAEQDALFHDTAARVCRI